MSKLKINILSSKPQKQTVGILRQYALSEELYINEVEIGFIASAIAGCLRVDSVEGLVLDAWTVALLRSFAEFPDAESKMIVLEKFQETYLGRPVIEVLEDVGKEG